MAKPWGSTEDLYQTAGFAASTGLKIWPAQLSIAEEQEEDAFGADLTSPCPFSSKSFSSWCLPCGWFFSNRTQKCIAMFQHMIPTKSDLKLKKIQQINFLQLQKHRARGSRPKLASHTEHTDNNWQQSWINTMQAEKTLTLPRIVKTSVLCFNQKSRANNQYRRLKTRRTTESNTELFWFDSRNLAYRRTATCLTITMNIFMWCHFCLLLCFSQNFSQHFSEFLHCCAFRTPSPMEFCLPVRLRSRSCQIGAADQSHSLFDVRNCFINKEFCYQLNWFSVFAILRNICSIVLI